MIIFPGDIPIFDTRSIKSTQGKNPPNMLRSRPNARRKLRPLAREKRQNMGEL